MPRRQLTVDAVRDYEFEQQAASVESRTGEQVRLMVKVKGPRVSYHVSRGSTHMLETIDEGKAVAAFNDLL
jgi:hypothetical protein